MGKDHSYVGPSTDDGEGFGFLRSRVLGRPGKEVVEMEDTGERGE